MSSPDPAPLPADVAASAAATAAPPIDSNRGTDGEFVVDLDPVWRALSDPTRRAILDVLREGPQNTGFLCDRFDHLSRHGVIKHLKALERANLVTVRVRGRERINHLNVVPIQEIYERWMRPYESYWASKLHRLAEEITRGETED